MLGNIVTRSQFHSSVTANSISPMWKPGWCWHPCWKHRQCFFFKIVASKSMWITFRGFEGKPVQEVLVLQYNSTTVQQATMHEILRFNQHGFNTAVLDVKVIGKDGRSNCNVRMSGPGPGSNCERREVAWAHPIIPPLEVIQAMHRWWWTVWIVINSTGKVQAHVLSCQINTKSKVIAGDRCIEPRFPASFFFSASDGPIRPLLPSHHHVRHACMELRG